MKSLPKKTRFKPTSVVTGAAGFLGSHLTDLLLLRGHRVVGIDLYTLHLEGTINGSIIDIEIPAIWGEPLWRGEAAGVDMPELSQLHRELTTAVASR